MNNSHVQSKKLCSVMAFTLVELLVVVAIIVILMGILLPALKRAKESAKSISCRNNEKQIGQAAHMYSLDYDNYIVPTFSPDGEKPMPYLNNWTGLIQVYLGRTSDERYASAEDLAVAACPVYSKRFGYGHNTDNLGRHKAGHGMTFWCKMTQANRPTETVFFTDNRVEGANSNNWDDGGWKPHVRGGSSTLTDVEVDFRHPGVSCNVVWLDGHVDNRTYSSGFVTPGNSASELAWWDLVK